MSTRAIIGIKNQDGTITGAWQWNDGMGLLPLLRRYFGTKEKVMELVKYGVWNNVVSEKDNDMLEHFKEFADQKDSNYYLVSIDGCYLLKERPFDSAESFRGDNNIKINEDGSMTFADFETANGQDINYLYLFTPDTNKWEVHR